MSNIEIKLDNVENTTLSVTYNYEFTPGLWTYPNGDPGYPEFEDINIVTILTNQDITDMLYSYKTCPNIIEEIEDKISEYERNKRITGKE